MTDSVSQDTSRRSFLKRVGAALGVAAAWTTGVARPAMAGTRYVSPGSYIGCSSCHGICQPNYCGGLGKMTWYKYYNSSGSMQSCSDHGWNGCIGVYACSGSMQWWMTYVGQATCCGCG